MIMEIAKSPLNLKEVGCYKQIAKSYWLIPIWYETQLIVFKSACPQKSNIVKIAETLAIGTPYWVSHCCVVHLWNNFLIRQKMTKIDFIARHKRIRVEKSVILTQPTCPTDKAKTSIFYQLVLQPFQVLTCNSHQDRPSLWHWDRSEKKGAVTL